MALPATSPSPQTPSYPHSNPSWLSEYAQRPTPHGQKRRADDADDSEDGRSNNISTNFKRLRINQNKTATRSNDYTNPDSHASITSHPAYRPPSVQSLEEPSIHHSQPSLHPLHHPQPSLHPLYHQQHAPQSQSLHSHLHPHHLHLSNRDFTHTPPPAPHLHPPSRTSTQTTLSDEPMSLDFDPHRVIISNLDAEIAEIEAEEQRAAREVQEREHEFFLPDSVEKEISGVPQHVLSGSNTRSNRCTLPRLSEGGGQHPSQALILYKDPLSIGANPEADGSDPLRQAVEQAKRRMRERQKEPPPPSPYTSHIDEDVDIHDTPEAEPYMRNELGDGRFGRERTPFPFPDLALNSRHATPGPRSHGPYEPVLIPIDVDDYNDIHERERHGGWDHDMMDIE